MIGPLNIIILFQNWSNGCVAAVNHYHPGESFLAPPLPPRRTSNCPTNDSCNPLTAVCAAAVGPHAHVGGSTEVVGLARRQKV